MEADVRALKAPAAAVADGLLSSVQQGSYGLEDKAPVLALHAMVACM